MLPCKETEFKKNNFDTGAINWLEGLDGGGLLLFEFRLFAGAPAVGYDNEKEVKDMTHNTGREEVDNKNKKEVKDTGREWGG